MGGKTHHDGVSCKSFFIFKSRLCLSSGIKKREILAYFEFTILTNEKKTIARDCGLSWIVPRGLELRKSNRINQHRWPQQGWFLSTPVGGRTNFPTFLDIKKRRKTTTARRKREKGTVFSTNILRGQEAPVNATTASGDAVSGSEADERGPARDSTF